MFFVHNDVNDGLLKSSYKTSAMTLNN